MSPPRETPSSYPVARAWLYGWAHTDVPGHRTIAVGGQGLVVASGTYRGDQLVAALNTTLSAVGWAASIANTGRVTLSGPSRLIEHSDRLGWLLGFAPDANELEPVAATSIAGRWVPPIAVPLLACQWERVEVTREVETLVDRAGRRSGYAFGGARLWRWRVRMTRWAYQALLTGWCLRGKVTVSPNPTTVTDASASQAGGGVTGYIVSAGSVSWSGPTEEMAELDLVIAGVTT